MKDVKICDYLWFQEGPGVRNTQYTTSGVKLINVANLVDGEVDISTSDRFISEEEAYGKYSHFMADEGDFVIASSGIKIDYFEKKMGFIKKEHLPLCMNTSCIRFKVNDSSKLDIKYFMYYLKSNSFKTQLFNQITGSAQLNFGPSHLKKMTFPIIEIDKQHEIVAKLEKTKQIIKSTKALLEKYDFLIKSRFIEMFGDPVLNDKSFEKVRLDTVADIKIGPFGSLLHQEDYIKNGHALVNPSHILDSKIVINPELTVSDEKYEELKSYHLLKDDVVMGRRGEMGRCAVVTEDGLLCGTGSIIIRSKGYLKPDFLQKIISFPSYKKTIEDKAVGQTMPNLNVPIVSSFEIIKPPKDTQDAYYAFVQQIDKSKFVVQKSLEKAETLYKSLMQEYFG